jgi:hypothetical protein
MARFGGGLVKVEIKIKIKDKSNGSGQECPLHTRIVEVATFRGLLHLMDGDKI